MPENTNVFDEKQDYLMGARDDVVKRDAMAAELEKMKAHQRKLSRNIAAEEKSIADEISSTVRKRKQEITDTYDGRLDDNRARKKKVANKRDKKKSQRVNERIMRETKHIREKNKEYEVEMRTLLKKDRVPGFCSTNLFYTMFMPHGISGIGAMLLSYLIYFAAIPAAVMFIVKKLVIDSKNGINVDFWCALVFFVILILQLILYFLIYNVTKVRHRETLKETRSIKAKIKANKKKMDAIKASINKDKDESSYNLGAYDEKLANLDEEADSIGNDKQEALKQFENETKQLIIDEINGRRLQVLEDMKADKKALDEKIAKGEKKYSDMVLHITNKYAAYIGEEFCKEDKLTDLILLMQDGQAETVSEAINLYKGQKASR